MTIVTNQKRREIKIPVAKSSQKRVLATLVALTLFLLGFFFLSNPKNLADVLHKPLFQTTQGSEVKEAKLSQVIAFLPSWIPLTSVDITNKNLTQVIYFGLGVNSSGEIIKVNEEGQQVSEWSIFSSQEFRDFVDLAHRNNIKVVVALKNFDNESIDNLVSNSYYTSRLSKELVDIARKYNIDGYNLDFEYVTDSDFPTKPYFNKFLKTVDAALDEEDPSLILSLDINALATIADAAYDVPKMGEILDHLIIMGYDYTQIGATYAGHIAPLYSVNGHSVSKTVEALRGKVPFGKVILGIPFYGYEWSTYSTSYGSRTIEGSGALATYKRVKKIMSEEDAERNFDTRSQQPWIVYRQGSTIKQAYYEDQESIKAKVGFVRDHSMAGIAVWVLGYEGDSQELWEAISQ